MRSLRNHVGILCRVQNMPPGFASRHSNIFIVAIVDGPSEGHGFDTIFDIMRLELLAMMPPLMCPSLVPSVGSQGPGQGRVPLSAATRCT